MYITINKNILFIIIIVILKNSISSIYLCMPIFLRLIISDVDLYYKLTILHDKLLKPENPNFLCDVSFNYT